MYVKYFKTSLLTILALLVVLAGFAQRTGTIKGRIIDQFSKQPILGATILIKGTSLGGTTDTTGIFSIFKVLEGNYSLLLSYTGFQQKVINDIIVVRDKTYYFETELLQNQQLLNEVIVQSFKNENNPQTPVSTYSFFREEIFRSPGAQGDIFRVLGILPGVSGSGGQFSAIAVRGQGIRDNVYMVDDIPMFEVSHLEGDGSGFNDPNGGRFSIFAPRVIDNAVFQGGGFAAQYGRKSSSYLGLGIKEGNKETPTVTGQFDFLGATLIYDGPSYFDKRTSVLASIRYQNFSLLEKIIGLKGIGLPSFGDYLLKTTTEINKKNKISFIAMYNPEKFTRTIKDERESEKVERTSLIYNKSYKATFGVNLRTLTSKNSYWRNILYYRLSDANSILGNSYPKANGAGNLIDKENIPYEEDLKKIKNTQHEIGYRSFYTQHFKSVILTTGIDLARINIDNQRNLKYNDTLYTFTPEDFRPQPSKYFITLQPQFFAAGFKNFAYNASVYVDFSFTILKRITINSGVRYDYTGFTKQNSLSPRLSGSVLLTRESTINFASGIYYQDPLYQDVADQPAGHTLKNERTIQYIVGYKNYFSSDLKLVVESWYKRFDNLVLRPQSGQVFLNNNGTGYAFGGDINLTKRLSKKYYGQIGYSYIQSKRDDHNGLGIYNYTYSQPHIFSVLASYKPNNKWAFSAKLRFATGRPKDSYIIHSNVFNDTTFIRYSQEITGKNAKRLNDYISLDVRADYAVQLKKVNFTWFIDIVNILNRYNQSSEVFQPITGKTFYEGLGIFPSFGLRIGI